MKSMNLISLSSAVAVLLLVSVQSFGQVRFLLGFGLKETSQAIQKKLMWVAVLLLLSLSSCSEYATRFPVSHESEAVSYDHLLGDWNLYQYTGDTLVHRSNTLDSHGIRIMSFNRNEFLIEVIPENDSALSTQEYVNDIHLMRGWITDIAGKQFLNLNPITESGYLLFSLYQIQINDDTLISTTISERLFKELNVRINSVSDHAAFVASVMDQDELWNVQYRYLKME